MNTSPNQMENSLGLGNTARAVAAIIVALIALFGALVVLDVITLDNAGEFAKKSALLTLIIVLAGTVIAFLMRSGKK